jgi:hypothetical protein
MLGQPLITHLYTADPSAHVFEGKIFVYPSHDVDKGIPTDDLGSQYAMDDYHVFSMDDVDREVTDHGVALALADVPWASKQLWAPDAAFKNGKYYLYFPARHHDGIFRIGVGVSDRPEGPFKPQPEPIKGSYSIDPAVFLDDDGSAYIYFGGLWGGQLQEWSGNQHNPQGKEPTEGPAINGRVAKLTDDMLEIEGEITELQIVDENGDLIQVNDHDRRFFEAAWMHKKDGLYYFSYSTGDTHYLVYATGTDPRGPFTYQGRILEPVIGWTTHHSIVENKGRWFLFHHDSSLSGGKNHLRSVKVKELFYDENGKILPVK